MDRRDALSGAWKAALSLSTLGAVVGAPPGASAGESTGLLNTILLLSFSL